MTNAYALPPTRYTERTQGEHDLETALWKQIYYAAIRSPALAASLGVGVSVIHGVDASVRLSPAHDFDDVLDRAEKIGVLSLEEAQFLRYWRANDSQLAHGAQPAAHAEPALALRVLQTRGSL